MELNWKEPWWPWKGDTDGLIKEIRKEICSEHTLFPLDFVPIGQRQDNDDVALALDDGKYAVAHPTWSGKVEEDPRWPECRIIDLNGLQKMFDEDSDDWE